MKYRCFGFYNDSPTCNTCVAEKRCRAITISDGFNLVEALLDEVLATDPGVLFIDTDRPSEMVSQLLNPEKRKKQLVSAGIIDELFGDDESQGGIFGADTAARAGVPLNRLGQAMTARDTGEIETEDNDGVEFL